MRIHLAGVIFKVSSISCVRSEDEHCHYGAAALTRNEIALDHFLGSRRAGRQINGARALMSFAHRLFHPASRSFVFEARVGGPNPARTRSRYFTLSLSLSVFPRGLGVHRPLGEP